MRIHADKLVAIAACVVVAGCANIRETTSDTTDVVGTVSEQLDPSYEHEVAVNLEEGRAFADAAINIDVRREKICRTQHYEKVETTRKTERTFQNAAVPISEALLAVGFGACGIAQAGGNGCVTSAEDDSGQEQPLTESENTAFTAVWFGLSAVTATVFAIDMGRSIDTSEVVATEREPTRLVEESCGQSWAEGVRIRVEPRADGQQAFSVQTNAEGRARIPLTRIGVLGLARGDVIADFVMDDREIAGPSMSSSLIAARRGYYQDRLYDEAARRDTFDAYMKYLENYPNGEHAPKAHRRVQDMLRQSDDAAQIERYLTRFRHADTPEGGIDEKALQDRAQQLLVEDFLPRYKGRWNAGDVAELPDDLSEETETELREQLLQWHRDLLATPNMAFAQKERHLEQMIVLADGESRRELQVTYAGELRERAMELLEDSDGIRPAAPENLLRRALDVAKGSDEEARIRQALVDYYARATRLAVTEGESLDAEFIGQLSGMGLGAAETDEQREQVRNALFSGFEERARRHTEDSEWKQASMLAGLALEVGTQMDVPSQARSTASRIQDALQSEFPPSKLQSTEQAVRIYVPPSDWKNPDALVARAKNPARYDGQIIAATLTVDKPVAKYFLADSEQAGLVFLSTTNSRARRLLDDGRRVIVIGRLNGTIPYRRGGDSIRVPKIEVIWAAQ